MSGTKGNSGGQRAGAGRPRKTQRTRSIMEAQTQTITPDAQTQYLIGPEGLVWVQPGIGEPHIIAARNEDERQAAEQFIYALVNMGLIPYGLPLDYRITVALFGSRPFKRATENKRKHSAPFEGSAIRDCQWVPYQNAPTPEGGEPLPTRVAIIL